MTHRIEDYLDDILQASIKAQKFVKGSSFADFVDDDKASFAVIRALEIVGEATKGLPPSFRNQHPDVPWRLMAGMRDKLIHGYAGVDLEVVWKTVQRDLPSVQRQIRDLIYQIR